MKQVTRTKSLEELSPILFSLLEDGVEVTLPVTGNSMMPLWKHGRDSVTLVKCEPFSLQKGDIPLYRRPSGQFVLHRIVQSKGVSYTMCGDAYTQREEGVEKNTILAVVNGFCRKGKFYHCTHIGYRIYTRCWMALRPVHGILLKFYEKLCG